MRCALLALATCLACSAPPPGPTSPGPEPTAQPAGSEGANEEAPPFAQPPPPAPGTAPPSDGVARPEPTGAGGLRYMSDCSLTHPVARDPCTGAPASDRGLASCDALGVAIGQACGSSSASCHVARTCADGHPAVADYLVCVDRQPSRCLTRSSRDYKIDVEYLSSKARADLARLIQSLPLATFRYKDQSGEPPRLGFLTEDAPAAPFVSPDGRTVDLYALLAATIATLQQQDARIRALESQLQSCVTQGSAGR